MVGSARVEWSGAGRRLQCSTLHIQKLKIGHAQQPQYCPHSPVCRQLLQFAAALLGRLLCQVLWQGQRKAHTDQVRLRRLEGRLRAAPVLGRTGVILSPAYKPQLLLQPPPAGTKFGAYSNISLAELCCMKQTSPPSTHLLELCVEALPLHRPLPLDALQLGGGLPHLQRGHWNGREAVAEHTASSGCMWQ